MMLDVVADQRFPMVASLGIRMHGLNKASIFFKIAGANCLNDVKAASRCSLAHVLDMCLPRPHSYNGSPSRATSRVI